MTEAHTHNFHRMFQGQMIADMSPSSFVLMVDRKNLVDSTVVQLSQSTENFKKPLQVCVYVCLYHGTFELSNQIAQLVNTRV